MTTQALDYKRPAARYTPEQRDRWSETDYNWHCREALMTQGCRALHIREAHEVGVADLLVYRQEAARVIIDGKTMLSEDLQVISAWLELKIVNDLGEIRPAQKEFMRDHWRLNKNAMFVMRDTKVHMTAIRQGDLKGRVMMVHEDPYQIQWQEVFQKFKSRKFAFQ